jgi:hypothetical protein
LFTNRQGPLPTALERTARLPTARKFAVWRRFYALLTTRSMRAILYEFLPDGLYSWVKRASACILLPGQYPYTCPETTLTPTGVSAGVARNGAPRGGVGRDNGTRRHLPHAPQVELLDHSSPFASKANVVAYDRHVLFTSDDPAYATRHSAPSPISTTWIDEAFIHEMPEELVGLVFPQADVLAYAGERV